MKKRLLAITLVITALLLAGCSLDTSQLAGSVNNVPVPDIIGKSLEDAKTELSSAGLQVGDIRYNDSDEEKDTVILSDPLPGSSASSGAKISLTLSSGRQKAPYLTIEMDVPEGDDDIIFTVYVDGVLNDAYTKTVNPAVASKLSFQIKGRRGIKQVNIKANDQPYKSYELDFDKGTITEE